jgi:glycosyltransferase involved in cell wall biosynthesis
MTEQLAVVVPVYNEIAVIEAFIAELDRAVMQKLPSAEALAIDDASTDGTSAALDRLATRHAWLHVEHSSRISLKSNRPRPGRLGASG